MKLDYFKYAQFILCRVCVCVYLNAVDKRNSSVRTWDSQTEL